MEPLNNCLNHYLRRREEDPDHSPTWLLFHDEDEYLFPADTNLTIVQALDYAEERCCVLVSKQTPQRTRGVKLVPVLITLYPLPPEIHVVELSTVSQIDVCPIRP